jgi:hypothetical protein
MSAKSTTVSNNLRPTLAQMREANRSRKPNAQSGEEPLSVAIGRGLSNVPKFFSGVATSYTYHRNLES